MNPLPCLVAIVLVVLAGCTQSPLAPTEGDQPVPGRYIVVLDDVPAVASKHPRTVVEDVSLDYAVSPDVRFSSTLLGFAAEISDRTLTRLEADPRVLFVEPDRVLTLPDISVDDGGAVDDDVRTLDDSPEGDMEAMGTREYRPWGVKRVGGGARYTGSAKAWVIDTGIDLDHPELIVDPRGGFNAFSTGADAASLDDRNGHGTHVSGIIAADRNGRGIRGVAAGATVVPVKVLDRRGSGRTSGVIAGVEFVASNASAGDVANMSLGGGVSVALNRAVKNAASLGIWFVLAAGNESTSARRTSPAMVNGTHILTVSSMGKRGALSTFSNFGSPVDWAAPGERIKSTFKGGGLKILSGTSMAAPHVAGLLLHGRIAADGTVVRDRDRWPDPIASREVSR